MKIISRYLAKLFYIAAAFQFIVIVYAIFLLENFTGSLITFFLLIIVGFLFQEYAKLNLEKDPLGGEHLNIARCLLLTSLSFILISAVNAYSYFHFLEGPFLNRVVDALFESISGFTTTGFTILTSYDVPQHMLFKRALSQWIGGLGILFFAVYMLSMKTSHRSIQSSHLLLKAQGYSEKMVGTLQNSLQRIFFMYCLYTVLGIAFLYFFGLNFFESVTSSFTAISTGGFVVREGIFSTVAQQVIVIILMILGSISFVIHNDIYRKEFSDIVKNKEIRTFFGLLVLFTLFCVLFYPNLMVVLFELTSALTGTGFSLSVMRMLPECIIGSVMLFMLIGGAVASTSGGIKQFRFYLMLRSIGWITRKFSAPDSAIIPLKAGRTIENDDLVLNHIFILTYLCVLAGGTIVFLFLGYGLVDALFQNLSGLGTVGLSTVTISDVPLLGKVSLMVSMILGRVEIFPVLVLLRRVFYRI